MTRDELLERLRALPILDQLADHVLELAGEMADSILRERLQALIDKPMIAGFAKPAIGVPAPTPTPGRKPNTCSTCGAIGFTARTCGVTHNLPTKPSEVETAPPPLSTRTPPLFAPAVPTASPRSRPPPRGAPPGWTPDLDRAEEHLALSELTLNRKTCG